MGACRVTLTLGSCLAVAVALTRSVLPRSLRFLANNSSAELFQLTVLAFCLVNAWISGYLVRPSCLAPCLPPVPFSIFRPPMLSSSPPCLPPHPPPPRLPFFPPSRSHPHHHAHPLYPPPHPPHFPPGHLVFTPPCTCPYCVGTPITHQSNYVCFNLQLLVSLRQMNPGQIMSSGLDSTMGMPCFCF